MDNQFKFINRHTPGLKNGKNIYFEKGEHVKVMNSRNKNYITDFVITSRYYANSTVEKGKVLYGYEGYKNSDRSRTIWFICDEQIVSWKGKVE